MADAIKRDERQGGELRWVRAPAKVDSGFGLAFYLSMIFSENRIPLFGIML
jgi:hypothetical protein